MQYTGSELSVRQIDERHQEDSATEISEQESGIQWVNIIFLPYQTWWQWIILYIVTVKCFFAPLQTISVNGKQCNSDAYKSDNIVLKILDFTDSQLCSPFYIVDTVFYIIHRQVADEAMKREYTTKPGFFIALDVISLIPFFEMFAESFCMPISIWPHAICYLELTVIYRIWTFFSLNQSHNYLELLVGYSLLFGIIMNALICFLIMWTRHGLCNVCHTTNYDKVYDWRSFSLEEMQEENFSTMVHYIYAFGFVFFQVFHKILCAQGPTTYIEFGITIFLMVVGYLLELFVIKPKLFGEALLRCKSINRFQPRVKRIIEETRRRNPSPAEADKVEKFYSLLWTKGNGISSIPQKIFDLPRYMRKEIKMDLTWAVFYHSPTFRKTTQVYKRWLCQYVDLNYKQPGERFFSGPHCYTNLYYLKSGIVQLLSIDDSTSPILSVTGGTIFGDICFYIPPRNRRLIARCLTYCEVLLIPRKDILMSLHKFPDDRRVILKSVNDRLVHAHDLFDNKKEARGQDRTEDEGVLWIKRRWWEVYDAVQSWKMGSSKSKKKCELPPEEQTYHCAKYIGQLVMCSDIKLQRKSIFLKIDFPWILARLSAFTKIWNRFIITMVYLVLLLHPPCILSLARGEDGWFEYFFFCADLFYILDIIISLVTAADSDDKTEQQFISVVFKSCSSIYFILNVLSTPLCEFVLRFFYDSPIWKFNRLIKTYMLFFNTSKPVWSSKWNLLSHAVDKIIIAAFVTLYVPSFVMFIYIKWINNNLSLNYFFSNICFSEDLGKPREEPCNEFMVKAFGKNVVFLNWVHVVIITTSSVVTRSDLIFGCAVVLFYRIINYYLSQKFIAIMYMGHREQVNYQYFVTNLKKHYKNLKIHPDLLKRLETYLNCHWNYYHGMDILHPNLLKDEPYDIYFKLQGALAEKIIGESKEFLGAEPGLIRHLACKAKFLILPKNSALIMFGVPVENVTWVVQGLAKSEYSNEKGNNVKMDVPIGEMLSMTSVLLGRASLRTYTSVTDVEILYIKVQDFFMTIRRFPSEFAHFERCKEEIGPLYDELFVNYVKKHRDYQKKLRERVFHARQSVAVFASKEKMSMHSLRDKLKIPEYFKNYRKDPESQFMMHWLTFRAVNVLMAFLTTMLVDMTTGFAANVFDVIDQVSAISVFVDIFVKAFHPYYDERGLIVTHIGKCILHYLTRIFPIDIIGFVCSTDTFKDLVAVGDVRLSNLLQKGSIYLHLYLITGVFNYYADRPSSKAIFLLIIKWQVVLTMSLAYATYFLSTFCIHHSQSHSDIAEKQIYDHEKCWMPSHYKLNERTKSRGKDAELLSIELLQIFIEGMRLSANAFLLRVRVIFELDVDQFVVLIHHVFTATFFWFQYNTCQALLILHSRGQNTFQQSVTQLKNFLKEERVPKDMIERNENYFMYWWKRTAGVNMKILMNERIGVVFRQDLNYYFYKKTFKAVDTLLKGGESLERMLASSAEELFTLPGEEVMREMDLTPCVFIVHRGKIAISRNNERVTTLTKGSIFGQMEGNTIRPSRVSARAIDHADLLKISIKKFQAAINEDTRYVIKKNTQSKLDYMAVKKAIPENPYNSIEYILRGAKTIKLPRMYDPVNAEKNKWYARWLLLVWVIGPVASAALVLYLLTIPKDVGFYITCSIIMWDLLHIINIITDFFSMELEVVEKKCVYVYKRTHQMKRPWLYIDIISLIVPIVSYFIDDRTFHIARLFRIYSIYKYHYYFCRTFKSTITSVSLKVLSLLLLLHAITCGWILFFCIHPEGGNHPENIVLSKKLNFVKPVIINHYEWKYRANRRTGCPRVSRWGSYYENPDSQEIKRIRTHLTPSHWQADYLVALCNVIEALARSNLERVDSLGVLESSYDLFMTIIIYLVELWFTSVVISALYTSFREMYHFDYDTFTLVKFLEKNDVSSFLLQTIQTYSRLLWQKQQGKWLPDITKYAPLCLREDLLSSLYMHHLLSASIFANLPHYFLRQVAVRFRRVVIFPGKHVVQEGEINPIIYFIHEGEVERWYTDKNGDVRMSAVLAINGYFGLIPGLFPNTPYQFTYRTRTVVDFVYLEYLDWQDLLDGYPDLKIEIYSQAVKIKKEGGLSASKISIHKTT